MALAITASGIATAIGAVADLVGVGTSLADAFGGTDYTQFLTQITNLLTQLVQQQQAMIGLLTYLTALMLASITNAAVNKNLERLQSDADYFDFLGGQGLLNANDGLTGAFKANIMLSNGLMQDLSVIHHNIMQDNLDLSSSLIAAYRDLVVKNPTLGAQPAQVILQTAYFFTRVVQYQYAGYGLLMWASQTGGSPTSTTQVQTYYKLMTKRIRAQTIMFPSFVGGYYQPSGLGYPDISDAAGWSTPVSRNSLRTYSAFNNLYWLGALGPAIRTFGWQVPDSKSASTDYNFWSPYDLAYGGGFTFDTNTVQTLKTTVCRHPTDPTLDVVYLTYVAANLNLYTYSVNYSSPGAAWYQVGSAVNITSMFPGWTYTGFLPGYFYSNMQLLCSQVDNKMYLLSHAYNFIGLARLDYTAKTWSVIATSSAVQKPYEDDPVYTGNFRMYTVTGQLVVSFLSWPGIDVYVLNTAGNALIRVGLNNKWVFGDWNDPSRYTTIEPVISDGILYYAGRLPDGIHTYRIGPISQSYVPAGSLIELPRGVTWTSDASGYNQYKFYNNLRIYYANDVAYLGGWNTTVYGTTYRWETCALQPTGWVCNDNANTQAGCPAIATSTVLDNSVNDVAQYYYRNGTIPVMWSRWPSNNNVWWGLPTSMLTNRSPIPVSSP